MLRQPRAAIRGLCLANGGCEHHAEDFARLIAVTVWRHPIADSGPCAGHRCDDCSDCRGPWLGSACPSPTAWTLGKDAPNRMNPGMVP
jgi:hypothetical protein